MEMLAKATEGFSGADISEICQRAAKNAIKESVAEGMAHAKRIEAGELSDDADFVDSVTEIRRDHFEEVNLLASTRHRIAICIDYIYNIFII